MKVNQHGTSYRLTKEHYEEYLGYMISVQKTYPGWHASIDPGTDGHFRTKTEAMRWVREMKAGIKEIQWENKQIHRNEN